MRWDGGLLAASQMTPHAPPRRLGRGAFRPSTIESVRALRNWRESVDVQAGPRRLRSSTREAGGRRRLIGQMARFQWAGQRRGAVAKVPVSWRGHRLADRRARPGRRGSQARRRAGTAGGARSRGRRASSRTRASWRTRRGGGRRRRAREARAPAGRARGAVTARDRSPRWTPSGGCSAWSCSACASGWTGSAGCSPRWVAAGRVPLDPCRRDERQVVDGAHRPQRSSSATASGPARTSRRTSSRSASGSVIGDEDLPPEDFACAIERVRARGGEGRPPARAGGSRSSSRRSRPRPTASWRGAASRSRSSRPGSADAGTRRTSSASDVAVLTNVGLEHTRWLGPDGARHRAREAGRRPARLGARARRRPAPRRLPRGARARPPAGVVGRAGIGSRARDRRRAAPSSGATSPPPRQRREGASRSGSTRTAVRAAAAAIRVPGPLRGRRGTGR